MNQFGIRTSRICYVILGFWVVSALGRFAQAVFDWIVFNLGGWVVPAYFRGESFRLNSLQTNKVWTNTHFNFGLVTVFMPPTLEIGDIFSETP